MPELWRSQVNRLRTSEADLEGAVLGNLAPPVAGRSFLVSQKAAEFREVR